jgi:hypothetical protein
MDEEGLFDVVGDGEDGGVADYKLWNESVAGGAVDASEGFVKDQEGGVGHGESAGEVDALKFAAGEVAGEAIGEGGESE